MESRSYIGDPQENDRVKQTDQQAKINTAIPGIIQSFDIKTCTCTVQPAINLVVFDTKGASKDQAVPLLADVPVYFPGGGGCHLTFPVKKGDECEIVFQQRCIDSWYQSGGVQTQHVLRLHDLSDAIVNVGLMSQPHVIPNISTESVQLRSDDGQAFVEINPESHTINLKTPGNIHADAGGTLSCVAGSVATIKAPNIVLDGNVSISGTVHALSSMQVDSSINSNSGISAGAEITAGGNISTPAKMTAGSVGAGGISMAGGGIGLDSPGAMKMSFGSNQLNLTLPGLPNSGGLLRMVTNGMQFEAIDVNTVATNVINMIAPAANGNFTNNFTLTGGLLSNGKNISGTHTHTPAGGPVT
jgi:phage baseplate assembly protein gpV